MFQPALANTATKKEPSINISEMAYRMGKIISCLLAFNTLKLVIAIVQPLEKRSKIDIREMFLGDEKVKLRRSFGMGKERGKIFVFNLSGK